MARTASAIGQTIGKLLAKSNDLGRTVPIRWSYPPRPPRDPLAARPGRAWARNDRQPLALVKNRKHWVYGDFVFPREICGIPTAGTAALLRISGWCPFTLWVDGREQFRERHVWYATGPIADPLTLSAGRHRLVMCLEPTEIPVVSLLDVRVTSSPCEDLAIQLEATAAQLQLAQALASTAAERALVAKAAAAVDGAALRANRWPQAMRSLARAEEILVPLSPQAKALTVRLLGHSHIDMDWMWTWKDTVHCIRRDFKAVTDLMDELPDLTFVISQIPAYDVVRRMDPAVFAKVRARVAEGRWENAAGTWVEGDLHMADGEAIARHILYAADWSRRHLGSPARVLWEPDTFGHPANMPQLARLGGFDSYFHMRCNPGRHRNWPARHWIGMDGTRIPAFSMVYIGDIRPTSIVRAALSHREFGLRDSLHVWGIGDHGGGMSRQALRHLSMFQDRPLMPAIRFGTVRTHGEAVRRSGVKLPANRGETYSLFEGCWTTHARAKKYNRQCEAALLTAETLSALAGRDRRAALRDAWTPVLFNQFHDLLDGAAVHDPYRDVYRKAEASLRAAAGATREALDALAPRVRGAGRDSVVVVNPLGFAWTGPVRARLPAGATHLLDPRGRPVAVQKAGAEFVFVAEDVGAFSAAVYRVGRGKAPGGAAAPVSVSEARDYGEQRDLYRVETVCALARISKRSGAIGSYYDKRLRRELVTSGVPKHMSHVPASRQELGLNVFQAIDESPVGMSAWHIHDAMREENLVRGAEVTLIEAGPVFARFRVRHRFRRSKIEEDVIFYNRLARVDFEVTVDWRERGDAKVGTPQLKLGFAASLDRPRARFEGPFGAVERRADGQEQPTQKWLDVSGRGTGFAVLNDGRYGCDVLGGRARMTLLRNPYSPDPETDNGVHRVRFAFVPHDGRMAASDLTRMGMAFNRGVITATGRRMGRGLRTGFRVRGSRSVVCTALRRAEHAEGLVARFFEADGKPAAIRFTMGRGIRSARAVDLREDPLPGRVRVSRGEVVARFRPYEVKTFLIGARSA